MVQNNVPLPNGTTTLGSILQQRGYRTGFIGKWQLDGDGKPQWVPARSFGFEDRPFFLMLSFPYPHGPNSVRKPYDTLFDDVNIPIPDTIRKLD